VALLTLGEGYHSFHHRFPADFRNGIRWYHWDPAKWFIAALRGVGLAHDLRAASPPQIEQARMHAELLAIEPHVAAAPTEIADDIRRRIADARMHLDTALMLWRQYLDERSRDASSAWRRTRRTARRHIAEARRGWRGARSLAT
jgi:stearoyl-CoA desaturase (delta-9 desaturase)